MVLTYFGITSTILCLVVPEGPSDLSRGRGKDSRLREVRGRRASHAPASGGRRAERTLAGGKRPNRQLSFHSSCHEGSPFSGSALPCKGSLQGNNTPRRHPAGPLRAPKPQRRGAPPVRGGQVLPRLQTAADMSGAPPSGGRPIRASQVTASPPLSGGR
jgi:hypothetical protein